MSINKPSIVLQPHLGRVKDNYKPGDKIGEYLCLAKVIKVHHKTGTADVQIVKNNSIISSSVENEGKYSARIGVPCAHFNSETLTSSGVVEPIQAGQLVLLAFMDNVKNQPVIITSFHDTWTSKNNILIDRYPLDERGDCDDYAEALKYLRVFPSQMYTRVDGYGGIEISLPNKTFLKIGNDKLSEFSLIEDTHLGYDHDNLSEKDLYRNFETLQGHNEEELMPIKLLFCHRSSCDNDQTTWTKFFIDLDGTWRMTRDNNDNTLTYMEMNSNGSYSIVRNNDISVNEEGINNNNIYTKLSCNAEGDFIIERNDNGKISNLYLDANGNVGMKHKSGSYLSLTEEGNIEFHSANNIIMSGKDIINNKEV